MRLRTRSEADVQLRLVLLALVVAALASTYTAWGLNAGEEEGGDVVLVASVDGVVDGAVRDYVESALEQARSIGAKLVVLTLNTPGGGLEPALEIVDLIRNSNIPVAGYVVDRWAMSAGTLILMCTHFAAMEPGTLIGAVQPVTLSPSGEYTPVNESKILNPIYKQIEACMKERGRNVTVARSFVYENLVLRSDEAVKIGAVEVEAPSLEHLLRAINGTAVSMGGGEIRTIVLRSPKLVFYDMGLGLRIAHVLSDPTISSIITSLAILIIIVALASGEPTLIGLGIALMIMGLFGLGFSASTLALALFVIGAIMLAIELMIPGFGVLGATGIALLVIGGFILFGGQPVYIAGESLKAARRVIMATVVPLAAFFSIAAYKAVQAARQRPTAVFSVEKAMGRAVTRIPAGGEGFVVVRGEYWTAVNVGEENISEGDKVVVVGREGPKLKVVKHSERSQKPSE